MTGAAYFSYAERRGRCSQHARQVPDIRLTEVRTSAGGRPRGDQAEPALPVSHAPYRSTRWSRDHLLPRETVTVPPLASMTGSSARALTT